MLPEIFIGSFLGKSQLMAPRNKVSGASRPARRRFWWQLRQRWSMLGVFEINQEHEFYQLTCMMKEGLHASVRAADPPGRENRAADQDRLSEEHFKAEETQTHEGFVMQTFAAPVFAHLRRSLDITEDEYVDSLCSDGFYLQFVSNSKSQADFFVTHDKRFFLKTQSRREVRFLLSNLQAYMDHLEKYPHSLLVRFLGVHRILIPDQIKKYFIVMQSVFYPDERINIRYDVKGCEVGRWTDPDTGGKQILKVLKDNNFRGQNITLGRCPLRCRFGGVARRQADDAECERCCRSRDVLVLRAGGRGRRLPASAERAGLQSAAGRAAAAPGRAGPQTLAGQPRPSHHQHSSAGGFSERQDVHVCVVTVTESVPSRGTVWDQMFELETKKCRIPAHRSFMSFTN
ncbi:phosphatidylinositol 4-phosphate 5-kinase-like protein 1 isoform X3 [Embiotoca jacksoni]|uniref:phosphatidylinositol 4-phosphate 5-kinase-like protein 1 isoform X3 n=1 Tax=Embiotoca jacksoni TaxID=100190 RepID=UPI0037044559